MESEIALYQHNLGLKQHKLMFKPWCLNIVRPTDINNDGVLFVVTFSYHFTPVLVITKYAHNFIRVLPQDADQGLIAVEWPHATYEALSSLAGDTAATYSYDI